MICWYRYTDLYRAYTRQTTSSLSVCSVNEFCISFGMFELANRIAERSHLKSSINSCALFVGARNKTKQFKRILIAREVETTRINYQAAHSYIQILDIEAQYGLK